MATRNTSLSAASLVACLVFFLASPQLSGASQTSGEIRVKEARGNPAQIVMPDGSTPPVRVNDAIPEGSLVKTPKNSFLSLLFANGAVLAIKPVSEILISRFSSPGGVDFGKSGVGHGTTEASESSTRLDLKSGLILLDLPQLNPKSRFEVSSDVGCLGIRGTRFYFFAQKGRGAVGVANGRVVVTSLLGETKSVGPGQAVGLTPEGLVQPTSGEINLVRELDATFSPIRPDSAPAPLRSPSQKTTPPSRATYQTSE